jgi:hypothetical protein
MNFTDATSLNKHFSSPETIWPVWQFALREHPCVEVLLFLLFFELPKNRQRNQSQVVPQKSFYSLIASVDHNLPAAFCLNRSRTGVYCNLGVKLGRKVSSLKMLGPWS